MRKSANRNPRRVVSPLYTIAARGMIGDNGADGCIFPYASHLYELSQGRGDGDTMRVLTIYMMASRELAALYKRKVLSDLSEKAISAWLAAGERCLDKGIRDRTVVNGDELKAMRNAFVAFDNFLPAVEIGHFAATVSAAGATWDMEAVKQ